MWPVCSFIIKGIDYLKLFLSVKFSLMFFFEVCYSLGNVRCDCSSDI